MIVIKFKCLIYEYYFSENHEIHFEELYYSDFSLNLKSLLIKYPSLVNDFFINYCL
jgi:hypothetical protein